MNSYRPEIDGLRALAVLPVVFFHAGFETFSGGYIGVDVFFIVSGYLTTQIIRGEIQQDTYSILNFCERHAKRILPALFVVTAATFLMGWLLFLPEDLVNLAQSAGARSRFELGVIARDRGWI